MVKKQTSVNIDVEKWETLKARGYKLQDIVDHAFNNLLDINLADTLELNQEKNNLIQQKKMLQQDLQLIEKEYEDKLNELKSKIKDVDFKLTEIDNLILESEEKAKADKKHLEELKEKNRLFNSIQGRYIQFIQAHKNQTDIERITFFEDDPDSIAYAEKYNISLEELSTEIHKSLI